MYAQVVRGLPATESTTNDQMSRFTANHWPYGLLSFLYRLLIPCLVRR